MKTPVLFLTLLTPFLVQAKPVALLPKTGIRAMSQQNQPPGKEVLPIRQAKAKVRFQYLSWNEQAKTYDTAYCDAPQTDVGVFDLTKDAFGPGQFFYTSNFSCQINFNGHVVSLYAPMAVTYDYSFVSMKPQKSVWVHSFAVAHTGEDFEVKNPGFQTSGSLDLNLKSFTGQLDGGAFVTCADQECKESKPTALRGMNISYEIED